MWFNGDGVAMVRRKPRILFSRILQSLVSCASDSVCNVLMEEKMSRRKSKSTEIEEMKSNNNLSNCWPMFVQYGQIDVSVSRFTRSRKRCEIVRICKKRATIGLNVCLVKPFASTLAV